MVSPRIERTKSQLPLWKRLNISELGLRIVLVGVIVVGGVSYLAMTSSVSTRGLQVKELNDRLEQLQSSRAVIQADVDRLQSMARLDAVSKTLDLVKVDSAEYLTTSTGAVASR